MRTGGRLLDASAKTSGWLEVLELRLEGKSDGGEFSHFIASRLLCRIVALIVHFARQVVPQALCKQVGTSVLNVRSLHTLYVI